MIQVRPCRHHNHSCHLLPMHSRPLVTACNHHHPAAACLLDHSQISRPFDDRHHLIEACMAIAHRGHLDSPQGRQHGHTATMARQIWVDSHCFRPVRPLGHWDSASMRPCQMMCSGEMRISRPVACHHGQTASQLGLSQDLMKDDPYTTL